jgi:nitroreductase
MDLATVDKLLTTTRSVRKRLDLTRPVDPEVLQQCLEIATQAPVGGNNCRFHFVVVADPTKRARIEPSRGRDLMQIRRAEAADEGALASIRRRAILALAVPAMSKEQAERWATRGAADRVARAMRDHDVWVAVEGAVIGWVEVDRYRVCGPADSDGAWPLRKDLAAGPPPPIVRHDLEVM